MNSDLSQAPKRMIMPVDVDQEMETSPVPAPELPPPPPAARRVDAGTLVEDLILAELAEIEIRKVQLSEYLKAVRNIDKRLSIPKKGSKS